MSSLKTINWSDGVWTTPPVEAREIGPDLVVTSQEGSDAWRHTSYGFVHENEHALVTTINPGTALEVEFTAEFSAQFDQAGVFLRASNEHWIKAGLEYADGQLQLGAVVTDGFSDWSVAPHPQWLNKRVLIRVSWTGESVTIRAGLAGGPVELVRVAPFRADGGVSAGPYTCAPTRAGLEVTFHAWRITDADEALH